MVPMARLLTNKTPPRRADLVGAPVWNIEIVVINIIVIGIGGNSSEFNIPLSHMPHAKSIRVQTLSIVQDRVKVTRLQAWFLIVRHEIVSINSKIMMLVIIENRPWSDAFVALVWTNRLQSPKYIFALSQIRVAG